jgi:murein DD-endopeptidase MepM/ murein hydrolase activator NlpD
VLLSGHLTLTGDTVVLDHGHGVLSVFYHLDRAEARPGEPVYAGQRVGYSGDSGLADTPHLHWGVYVHGVAVDPKVMEDLDG